MERERERERVVQLPTLNEINGTEAFFLPGFFFRGTIYQPLRSGRI